MNILSNSHFSQYFSKLLVSANMPIESYLNLIGEIEASVISFHNFLAAIIPEDIYIYMVAMVTI